MCIRDRVIDSNGRVLLDNTAPKAKTILKDSTAYLLTQAMISVVKEGTGTPCQLEGGKMCIRDSGKSFCITFSCHAVTYCFISVKINLCVNYGSNSKFIPV